ncbi:Enoyl-[Datura stramonium]|uniref:Enoyl-[acyl-carrier-protein] reductase [NADPH, B-specific] 2, mitochondrial n=1 Tax=Datura stramonium TaxID=4076 RepID=A0ABS8S3K9_DATST|nr:Enoyl-[acyl-carrier-protein] reductase [NADPH, B-specific] 2, mitochondrial [Datura stramonium]
MDAIAEVVELQGGTLSLPPKLPNPGFGSSKRKRLPLALSHAAVLEESYMNRIDGTESSSVPSELDALCANQARKAFSECMSHGLRRPMHSISGLLSMLQDDKKGSQRKVPIRDEAFSATFHEEVFQVILHMVGNDLKCISGGKLDQLMQGDIWRFPNPEGSDKSIAVVLGFQILPSSAIGKPEYRESTEQSHLQSILHGVRVLLADSDDFQIVLLDLHLPDLDGIEVTMRIQNFQSRNWPLIIGLAATADEDVREDACRLE